jgi:hypothetical protein
MIIALVQDISTRCSTDIGNEIVVALERLNQVEVSVALILGDLSQSLTCLVVGERVRMHYHCCEGDSRESTPYSYLAIFSLLPCGSVQEQRCTSSETAFTSLGVQALSTTSSPTDKLHSKLCTRRELAIFEILNQGVLDKEVEVSQSSLMVDKYFRAD